MDEVDEVGGAGAVKVEEEGWVGSSVGKGGEVDEDLVPGNVGWVGGVVWGGEMSERGVGRWSEFGRGGG